MHKSPDQSGRTKTKAAEHLASLQQQAAAAEERLHGLLQAVEDADARLSTPLVIEANEQLILGSLRTLTALESAEGALHEALRSSDFDTLTQLPNRVQFRDRLAQAISHARRHGTCMALMFLDLDNFKQVNDSLGHAVGDEVLKLAARRLTAAVREEDVVSRLGGDEFVILLTQLAHASDAVLVAESVIASLAVPKRVSGHLVRLQASIGISLYPNHGEDADVLLDRADIAMYRAKRSPDRSFAFHGEDAEDQATHLSPLPASLRTLYTSRELSVAEQRAQHGQLREANEQLLITALGEQQLHETTELAHHRQMELLAVVAHELRNPLTPMRMVAELLVRVRSEELPRLKGIIEREVVHMARLVGDLLDVSRVQTGKMRLECRSIDLIDVIEESIEACKPAMDARRQRFAAQMPERPCIMHGDAIRLAQVLRNLLDNASKYTPETGQIELSLVVVDERVVLTVSDWGIGIRAEALSQVFEPFVQDSDAIGYNGAGLGIGLTVVRELVEAHGGTVVALSEGSGRGSRFVVTLPVNASSAR